MITVQQQDHKGSHVMCKKTFVRMLRISQLISYCTDD